MRDTWLGLVDTILRPARPHLARCLEARDRHLVERARIEAERMRAIDDVVRRIEAARARVFATNDGVVGGDMTTLEREWRRLSRRDPDAGLMDLWARIAPPSWLDRKRWRDAAPAERLDVAVLLAADVDGIESAEAAARALGRTRIRYRATAHDEDCITTLLAEPLRVASEGLAPAVLARAERLAREVEEAMRARLPDRPLLARSIAHAALVDVVWRAAPLRDRPDPVAPLVAVWRTGYALADIDATTVTLELPPLH